MPAFLCVSCKTANASMKRPKNGDALCRPCFFRAVEDDCHRTIIENNIFTPGEVVASGASGGKDSTVLMHLLKLLNERHNYGIKLHLVSVDEGITGYRDESLVTVRRNSTFYDLPLTIVSYEDLYNGWSMDKIVAKIGNKSNCTYCGVFRRHALEKGARMAGATKIATGHNADDTSETVLMNMLRSDMPRLERCTKATTNEVADDDAPLADNDQSDMAKASIPRVKPLRDLYEKEIVLYAHFQNLDYFSTECTYSKEAFRGNARTLLKQLEAISPRCIANIITSGEEMFIKSNNNSNNNKKNTSGGGDERQQQQQQDQESANRVATLMMDDSTTTQSCSSTAGTKCCGGGGTCSSSSAGQEQQQQQQQLSKANLESLVAATTTTSSKNNKNNNKPPKQFDTMSVKSFAQMTTVGGMSVSAATMANLPSQIAQKCKRCGSLSSRPLCRACVLVESLNGTGPKIAIGNDSATGVGGCGRSS